MKILLWSAVLSAVLIGGLIAAFQYVRPPKEFFAGILVNDSSASPTPPPKTMEELVREAHEKSGRIKGIYMTADVAQARSVGGTRLRNNLIRLADQTEVNGIVIDVKEVCGPDYDPEKLKQLLGELHQKNIWAIARIVVFKDASQIYTHPDWYLFRTSPKPAGDECARKHYLAARNPAPEGALPIFWRDKRGGYWLDPSGPDAQNYIVSFAKQVIDLGFDELQFDYLRFPSDGDIEKAKFPYWNGKTPKYAVLKQFFEYLNKNLKAYRPDIILSADLFGYASILKGDVGIGQRLEDIGDTFDYISFMVYPSHYYSGLYLPADPVHKLPAVAYNLSQARTNPDVIVGRSLLTAREFLDGPISTSTLSIGVAGTSTAYAEEKPVSPRSHVHLRPWLEDFYHEDDHAAGRPYGEKKVRMQIEAAEAADDSGWLLWNAANIYTESALKKE